MPPRQRHAPENEHGTLQLYFHDLRDVDLPTEEEERALGRRIRQGDGAAREEMICRNQRLVVSIARKYQRNGLPLWDLIAEGTLGLMRAVELYDPEAHNRFATYAKHWIRQSIRRGIANTGRAIRIPIGALDDQREWENRREDLESRLGKEPSEEEVNRELNLTPSQIDTVRHVRKASKAVLISLIFENGDDTVQDGEALGLSDNAEPADAVADRHAMRDLLRRHLRSIPKSHRAILQESFGLGGMEEQSYQSIGRRRGITKERVRQIRLAALQRLRRLFGVEDAEC